MTEIEVLLENANNDYSMIKQSIEEKVVEWFWSQGSFMPYEPYAIEKNRFRRPIKINSEPQDKKYHCEYGIDNQGNIIVERDYDGFGYTETFYTIADDKIVSHHYQRNNSIINCRVYYRYKGNTTEILSMSVNGKSHKKFVYNNDVLLSQECVHYDTHTQQERVTKYFYEFDGDTLKSIKTEDSYYCYRRTIGLSFEDLGIKVKNRIATVIKNHIKTHKPKEQIFAICIFYSHHHYFEPSILFSLESERKHDDDDKFLWSYYEQEDVCQEVDITTEDIALFDEFQQEIIMNAKDQYAVDRWLEITSDLKKQTSEFGLNKTDDFVFIVSDFDDIDLADNFNIINPERYDDFKDML